MIYRRLNADGTYSVYNGRWIRTGGRLVLNPSAAALTAAGYEQYEPPVPAEATPAAATEPGIYEMVSAVKKLSGSMLGALSDGEACEVAALYPTWISKAGQEVKAGDRLWYDGSLWKVVSDHTVDASDAPSDGCALYTRITADESGTLENPRAYSAPMDLEEGRYYSEDGTVYRCTLELLSSTLPLSQLVGSHVEKVDTDTAAA